MEKNRVFVLIVLSFLVFFLGSQPACSLLESPSSETSGIMQEEMEEGSQTTIKKEYTDKEATARKKALEKEQMTKPKTEDKAHSDAGSKEAAEPQDQVEQNQGVEGELEEGDETAGQESQGQEEPSPGQTTKTEDAPEAAPTEPQEEIYKIGKYLPPYEESGSANSDGLVAKNMVFIGDDDSNFAYGGFLTFNISMFLDKNVQIRIVRLRMEEPVAYGDHASLGTVDIRIGDYGQLDYSDIWFSQTKIISLPANTFEIDYGFGDERLAKEMQKAIDSGKDTFQFAIFRSSYSNNNQIDGLKYWFHNIILQVNLDSPVNF